MARFWPILLNGSIVFVLLALLWLVGQGLNGWRETRYSGRFRVIDGDSLASGDARLRLKGIDAPEYKQTCGRDGGEWPCGHQAREFLEGLVSRAGVVCSGERKDKYRRLLVVCRDGDTDLNAKMVLEGMAVAYGGYGGEERSARAAKRGIWAGSFELPEEVRKESRGGSLPNWLRKIIPWW